MSENGILHVYHHVGCLIGAYSFTNELVREDSPERIVLIPLADSLNHSSTMNNARLFTSKDGKYFLMKATADIQPESQIVRTLC